MTYPIQPSFAAGELAPSLFGRVDLNKYSIGLKRLENFVVMPHGGVVRRPGTMFITTYPWDSDPLNLPHHPKLMTFQYSLGQGYCVAFGHLKAWIYRDGHCLANVTSPYPINDVQQLRGAQSGDILFLVHPKYPPQELRRLGDKSWELVEFKTFNGPFRPKDPEQDDISITPSGQDGEIELTASKSLFRQGHVGSLWSFLYHADTKTQTMKKKGRPGYMWVYKNYRVDTNGFWAGTIKLQKWVTEESRWVTLKEYTSPESPHAAKNFTDSGEVDKPYEMQIYSENFKQFVPEGNTDKDKGYAVLTSIGRDKEGFVKITEFISETKVKAKVISRLAGTAPTRLWREGAWSGVRGFPSTVGFYQERLCFASSPRQMHSLWMSQTGDYENFGISQPIVDTDALSITLAARKGGEIRALLPMGNLLALTASSEWQVSPGRENAITPTSVFAEVQSYRGSADVEPCVVGNRVLFVQAQGARVRDFSYNFESDGYTGNDLSLMSSHLFDGYHIKDIAYQQSPFSVLWVVRSDGMLLSLTYLAEQDVFAWARHPMSGKVKQVTVVSDNEKDEVYLLVEREFQNKDNEKKVRLCLERFSFDPQETESSALYLDCSRREVHPAGSSIPPVWDCYIDHRYFGPNPSEKVEVRSRIRPPRKNVGIDVDKDPTIPVGPDPDQPYPDFPDPEHPDPEDPDLDPTIDPTLPGDPVIPENYPVEKRWMLSGATLLTANGSEYSLDGNWTDRIDLSEIPKENRVNVTVGIPYKSALETLDIDLERQDGAQMGRKIRVAEITIRVDHARGLFAGVDSEHLSEYIDRTDEPYGASTRLQSGDWKVTPDSPYYQGSVYVEAHGAMPAGILSIVPKVIVGAR